MTTHHYARRIHEGTVASSRIGLALSVPAGLKLVFAKVALDLPFPVPGGAGVAALYVRPVVKLTSVGGY